jgi:CRP-like cAMP-binding protein
VLLVPRDAMRNLMASDTIRRGLEWGAEIRESIMAEWLVNIASRKAHARLAHLLCELSVRMNSIDQLDHDACDMPLTQIDLANALAMTNVHLNVALQRLRAAKLVDVSARHLTILSRPQLEAIAEFDDEYLLRWPTELPDRRHDTLPWRDSERRSRPPRHF